MTWLRKFASRNLGSELWLFHRRDLNGTENLDLRTGCVRTRVASWKWTISLPRLARLGCIGKIGLPSNLPGISG